MVRWIGVQAQRFCDAVIVTFCQVVMKVVQILPDGHRMKKEVDMALDTVSETMTPMHYHLREIIICTYRQVRLMFFVAWVMHFLRYISAQL